MSSSNLEQVLGINQDLSHLESNPKGFSFVQIGIAIDRLRKILKARGILSIKEDLFDGRSTTNIVEFKNAVLKLGMSTRDIERMFEAISTGDGRGGVDLDLLQKKIERLE